MPGPGLPPGWEKVLDRNSGQYYFYNARLGVTQWDPPQVGAQKTKATFVTTTTRTKKVARKPIPLAYQHQPVQQRAVQQTRTVTTVRHTGGGSNYGNGGCLCNQGDAIFLSALSVIVIVIIVCMNTVGAGTYQSGNIMSGTYVPSNTNNNQVGGGSSGTVTSGCGASSTACIELKELVNLVNQHRTSIGESTMKSNTMLNQAAQRHSCYMATYTIMSHTGGPDATDRTLVSRIEKTGYKYSAAGENVAMGQSTAQRVMTAWLNSEGHRRNIESKDFDEIGVGLRSSDTGDLYWTQVFGKQSSSRRTGVTVDTCMKQLPGL